MQSAVLISIIINSFCEMAMVGMSVCPFVCHSVTRWHCVKISKVTIVTLWSILDDSPMNIVSSCRPTD